MDLSVRKSFIIQNELEKENHTKKTLLVYRPSIQRVNIAEERSFQRRV